PQSETVWRQADSYAVPRLAFVNKMDKVGADFQMNLDSIKSKLGANAVPIQWPIGAENTFKGLVDIIEQKAYVWHDENLGAQFDLVEIPADLKEKAVKLREELV